MPWPGVGSSSSVHQRQKDKALGGERCRGGPLLTKRKGLGLAAWSYPGSIGPFPAQVSGCPSCTAKPRVCQPARRDLEPSCPPVPGGGSYRLILSHFQEKRDIVLDAGGWEVRASDA